jgi:hypothetical protein
MAAQQNAVGRRLMKIIVKILKLRALIHVFAVWNILFRY